MTTNFFKMFNFNNKNSFFGIDYDDFFKPSKSKPVPPPPPPPPPRKKRKKTKTVLTDEEAERMAREFEERIKAKREKRSAKGKRLSQAAELMAKFEEKYPDVLTDDMIENFYQIVRNELSDAPLIDILKACIAVGKQKV